MTGMPRWRATWPTALTDCANSGPTMISAPCAIACCAAAAAPCGVPPSSCTSSEMFGCLNSASASSAAFFIDCAATPALPCADSGRIRPTRICPVPMVAPGGGSPACCSGGGVVVLNWSRLVEEQAASAMAAAAMPNAVSSRRRPRDHMPSPAPIPAMAAPRCPWGQS